MRVLNTFYIRLECFLSSQVNFKPQKIIRFNHQRMAMCLDLSFISIFITQHGEFPLQSTRYVFVSKQLLNCTSLRVYLFLSVPARLPVEIMIIPNVASQSKHLDKRRLAPRGFCSRKNRFSIFFSKV